MIQRQEYAEVPVYMGQASASLDKGRFLMPENTERYMKKETAKDSIFI